MITRKHDLLDTQASSDLVVPFQELAFKLGIGWKPNGNDMVVRENYGVIVCRNFGHGLELAHRHNLKEGLKQLTLSDLKPRTKVEYEMVTLSLSEKSEILESGEWLYLDPDGRTHIDMNCAANWTIGSLRDREVYRKVERPVEWWEDAAEFIVENDDDDLSAYFDKQSGYLRVNTSLSRDKWCDFARILLEQEGE